MAVTILGFDGFDIYDSASAGACNLSANWSLGHTSIAMAPGAGRFGGQAVNIGNHTTAQGSILASVPSLTSIGVASAHNCNGAAAAGSGAGGVISLQESGTVHLSVSVTAAGVVTLARGSPGATVLGTASITGVENGWHMFELYAAIADTGGTADVWVDGTKVISYSGDTRNGGTGILTGFALCSNTRTGLTTVEYVDDSAWGSTIDRIGDFRVDNLSPGADTAQKDFTPSTGTSNYACVDDRPVNSADYVSSNVATNEDLYTMTDLPSTSEIIFGVKITATAEKDNAGSRSLATKIKSSTTVASGTTTTLGTAYAPVTQYALTDPATSAAWTDSGVNALLAGFEVT